MARGGGVSGKLNSRKKVGSSKGGSDDSDEDYVVSDEGGVVSDCPEDSFDGFIEDEDEEEEEEEETQRVRKFNRSKAKTSIRDVRENACKSLRKRGRTAYAEQLEQEEEEQQEGDGDEEEDEYEDEDFNYDDDDDEDEDDVDDDEEFTPDEENYSDMEDEKTGRKKKNNCVKMGRKVLQRKVSETTVRGRKRRRSRASKKPLRKKRRKNGGLRRKVRCDEVDDFIDNGPAIRTKSRKILVRKRRRRLFLEGSNSDSDHLPGSPNYKFTISDEEREQVREAKEFCRSLRRSSRSSSLQKKNEEVGVHEDLQQQRRPLGRKGKEKIEEPQGRKGKEKVDDLKNEVVKQVCGICLSEENKRRVRGVLNCCTHYFCFACIIEWAKVESRCPLCKQRFKTISKPARSTAGVDLREAVIQVPKRDQVYQPSEEELRSYIDPYEYVICSECHQGGDDELMLLCDICDSPAHTYCVGLGREVPDGDWYCDGCRPVAMGTSSSQVQGCVADPRVTTQSLPVRPSPVHVMESIDLNLMSSPRTSFSQGLGHLSSSRFSGRSVEGASPVSGGGAPTLSERRWIHRHIHQLLSNDRMTSTTGRPNGISATSSTSNLFSSQVDQDRESAIQHKRTQDVGSSYHPFFEERLGNNVSPFIQNGVPFSTGIGNSVRPTVQDSTTITTNRPVDGVLWHALVRVPTISDHGPVHQFSSRSNIVPHGNLSPAIKEESDFPIVKEQLQSMVKSHLNSLSRDINLGHSTFKDIARSSTHTILAACGLEHRKSEVCNVPPPSICHHTELMPGGQSSLIKGCCSSCFDSFVGDVVKRIFDTKMSSQWLRLGL